MGHPGWVSWHMGTGQLAAELCRARGPNTQPRTCSQRRRETGGCADVRAPYYMYALRGEFASKEKKRGKRVLPPIHTVNRFTAAFFLAFSHLLTALHSVALVRGRRAEPDPTILYGL